MKTKNRFLNLVGTPLKGMKRNRNNAKGKKGHNIDWQENANKG